MTNKSLTSNALSALKAGLAVIPILPGSKKAAVAWGVYQKRPPTEDEVREMFAGATAIAILCGESSGNLEAIDFDDASLYPKWVAQLSLDDRDALLEKLVVQRTPSGGCHVLYRAPEVEGNQKLAWRDGKIGIETRGSGGYVLAAPSPGYELVQGKFSRIPTLSAKERDILLDAARWYDRSEVEDAKPEDPFPKDNRQGVSCADRFNAETSWADILSGHGWTIGRRTRNGRTPATRPGKDPKDGISATISADDQILYVFTSNAPALEGGRAYSKFQVYSALEHAGDYSAAARHLLATRFARETREKRGQISTESDDGGVPDTSRKWLTFDQIEEMDVEWLFEPYFPLGVGYVLLYGDSGYGKSTTLLAMIAAMSNGDLPFSDKKIEPVKSIILSAEDSASHVVKPRLREFGADMRKVMAPEEFDEEGMPTPFRLDEEGVEELSEMVVRFGAKMVVIDPLTSYFTGDNINDRLQARAWTLPLTKMAIRTGCCPVIVHHVNKSSSTQGRYRGSGSQDFFDASRSALMAVRSTDNEDEYALSHEKHNLTIKGDGIGYLLDKKTGFAWTGASDLTPENTAWQQKQPADTTKVGTCKEWIVEQIETHGSIPSDELEAAAKSAGFSVATYRRARGEAHGIKTFKEPGDGGRWMVTARNTEDRGW